MYFIIQYLFVSSLFLSLCIICFPRVMNDLSNLSNYIAVQSETRILMANEAGLE